MAQEVGQAYVTLLPSTRGFEKNVKESLGGAFDGAEKQGSSAFSGLAGKVVKWFAAAAIAVGGYFSAKRIFGGGLDRLLNIEDAQAKLRGLGHDADSVTAIMTDALNAVRGTAYGLDTAATVAASAVAAGIEPGQELERYLRLTADAATIAGSSMDEMGGIINQVTSKGYAGMENMNRLTERGIPIMQWLADEYGVTADELSKMVSRGEVDAETFRKVIEDNIGGAALASGDTTRGAFANMNAALSRVGANLLGGVFPMFKEVFGGITDALGPVEEWAARAGAAFGDWATSAVPVVQGLLDKIVPLAQTLWSTLGPALQDLAPLVMDVVSAFSPLGLIMQVLGPILPELAAALVAVGGAIGGTLAAALPVVSDLLASVAATLSETLLAVLPSVVTLMIALADAASALLPSLVPIVEAIGGTLAAVLPALVPVIGGLVTGLASLVTWVVDLVTPLMENEKLVLGIVAALALWKIATLGMAAYRAIMLGITAATYGAAGATYAAGAAQRIYNALMGANKIRTFIATLWTKVAAIGAATAATVTGVARQIAAWALLAVQATVQAVRSAAAWAVGVIVPAAQATATMAVNVARQVAQWVILGAQSMLHAARVAAAWLIAMGPIGLVIAAVVGLVALIIANWDTIRAKTIEIWGNITGWLSNTWESIKTTATNVWNAVLDFFRGIPEKIKNAFLNFTLIGLLIKHWDTIRTNAVNAWNRLVDWVKGIPQRFVAGLQAIGNIASNMMGWVGRIRDAAVDRFNALVDWVRGIPQRVVGALGNVGRLLYNAGRNIISGLWDGLKSMWENVTGWVSGLGSWIADNKGPKAYDLALLKPAGRWIMQGLQDGLRSEMPALLRTLDDVGQVIADTTFNPVGLDTNGTTAGMFADGTGGRGGPFIEQNIHPTPGLSEQQIADAAASRLEFDLRMVLPA